MSEAENMTLERYLQRIHPDDRASVREAVERALKSGIDLGVEFRIPIPGGDMRWIEVHGKVERGLNDRPLRLRGVAVDIAARKQAEADLARQRRDLAHVQRVSAMGQLSAALAHEISQPLGAILRNAEAAELYLRRNPPDFEELQAIIADIRRDDRRASAVIDRMRSLLKRRELDFEALEVGELIAQVVTLLRAEIQARHAGIQVDVPPGLPKVRGDRVHLQQVILNLLLNGLDALEAQSRERRQLAIRASQPEAGQVEIAVIDQGSGIPADMLPRLFEPFVTTKAKGTGIGLAISKTIVAAHGGQIRAENNAEGGATIRFTLNVSQPQAPA